MGSGCATEPWANMAASPSSRGSSELSTTSALGACWFRSGVKRCAGSLRSSCAGTTAIGLMVRSAFGRPTRFTPTAFRPANVHDWNYGHAGLADRSVHHLRLRWMRQQAERDRRSSWCRLSVAGATCPSSRCVALHSCPSPVDQPRHPCAWNCIIILCCELDRATRLLFRPHRNPQPARFNE